ncbi:MAG: beta-N-acetylglucosaminidase domain-containing protein [Halioglobus sp.]
MTEQSVFSLGVVEGFYGRPWPHSARLAYAGYLSQLGLNSYLYCPKSDPFLRRRWQELWSSETHGELQELAETYSAAELDWGVGLSPYALYENYGNPQRQALKRKVEYLSALKMPTLAILFDDMPGALESLADRQAEIVADVCAWAPSTRILVCPTYYSFDPVLEKYFGNMPVNYWRQLGRDLPVDVDIFWTGNSVCSESISGADIDRINGELGRRVMLWDNYPVNDGAIRSNFLYSTPLSQRGPDLAGGLTGHYCNPMNQPLLSLMALYGLADLYGVPTPEEQPWLNQIYGRETYEQLLLDKTEFEALGLSGMGERRCHELARLYGGFSGNAAAEVAAWLRGEYTFDPACLTD